MSKLTSDDFAEFGLSSSLGDKEDIVMMSNDNPTPPPYPGNAEDNGTPLLKEGYKTIDQYSTLNFPTPLHLGMVIMPWLRDEIIKPYGWQSELCLEIGNYADKATLHEPFRYALCAANGSGKDFIIVQLTVLWFALKFRRSLQIITSASGQQLNSQTENYLKDGAKNINNFFGCEIFRIRQRFIKCNLSGSEIRLFATDESGKAEGYHPLEPNAKMAIWVNEAKSVTEDIFGALRRCTGYTHWFNVSTPGKPAGSFYRSFISHYFRKRRVTSYECPDAISESDRNMDKEEFGPDSAHYRSKHLALFTSIDDEVVIPLHILEKCRKMQIRHSCKHWEPRTGIDLAAGGDENSVSIARGNKVVQEDRLDFREADTTRTATRVNDFLLSRGISKTSNFIFADDGGVGHAIIDMLELMGWTIQRVNNQSRPINNKRYGNRGAENWYRIKRFFEEGFLIPPDDSKLVDQLVNRRFKKSGDRDRIYLEKKAAAKAEGRPSPDRADSYVLAFSNLTFDDMQESVSRVENPKSERENRSMTPEQFAMYYANNVTYPNDEQSTTLDKSFTSVQELMNN